MNLMSSKNIRRIALLLFLLIILLPTITLAAEEKDRPRLPNPLNLPEGDLRDVLLRGLQVILGIIDIFALFMFILGGFELLTSSGNPDRVKKGKETLIWATAGILVITLSYAVLKFVFESISKVS